MAKLRIAILHFSLLFIIFCQSIDQVNTLRCAHSCAFGPIPLGSTDPIKTPCNTVDVDTTTTVCSVLLNINFRTSLIRGSLNNGPRLIDKSSSLDLSFTLLPASTTTFITYRCATTDDCDQDFVRETVSSSNWTQFNETKIRTDITSLLFKTDTSTDNLICANNLVCSWNQNCYAQLNSTVSSINHIDFNNNFPCDNTPSEVIFGRHFNTASEDQVVTMQIYCNKDECNEQKTVEQVYNLFQDEFILPLNYSQYIPGPPESTTEPPKPNGSHRINDSIKISVLSFFIFIFLKSIFL